MISFHNIKKTLLLLFLFSSSAFADDLKSIMPPPNEEDRIYTLNNMGAMCNKFDSLNSSFIEYAIKGNRKTMDVGCAYGNTVIKILDHGGDIIAIDLDERHLKILVILNYLIEGLLHSYEPVGLRPPPSIQWHFQFALYLLLIFSEKSYSW